MPVNMQNLQNISKVTDLDQLKIGADNQLQQRSALGTLFRKVGDAFLGLRQSGRAAIALRNERIMAVIRETVNSARSGDAQPEARDLSERLSDVVARLGTMATRTSETAFNDAMSGLEADSRFRAMPEDMQQKLTAAFTATKQETPVAKWNERFETLKSYFFGTQPASFDLQKGLQDFKYALVSPDDNGFLSLTQQRLVSADGIHQSFIKDTARRNVKSFNGEDTPAQPQVTPDQLSQYCVEKLRDLLDEEHSNLLPFVSMMASQAGLESAAILFPGFCGLHEKELDTIRDAGFVSRPRIHDIEISSEGSLLRITSNFETGYATIEDISQGGNDTFTCSGAVTMLISLDEPPTAHEVDGKTVYVPEFTLTGDVRMERA